MTDVRVFIGVDPAVPGRVGSGGPVATAPVRVHRVTAELRSSFPEADDEDLEYEAMWAAAADCSGRIIVAAVDVPEATLVPAERGLECLSAVGMRVDVPASALVSWHIELEGDEEDDELSWYDSTESAAVASLVQE